VALLLQLVSLLPESMFIDVIGGLLSHDLPTIQRKAMELLNTKLQTLKELEDQEVGMLVTLFHCCILSLNSYIGHT